MVSTELAGPGPAGVPRARLLLGDPADEAAAGAALGAGAVLGHAFGNFYVITTRPDAATVRSVNLLKGRPPDQVGSVTSTPLRIPRVYDWSALPAGLAAHEMLGLMDALFELGPFGFRGPAAPDVPEHLTQLDAGVRTAQASRPATAAGPPARSAPRRPTRPAPRPREPPA